MIDTHVRYLLIGGGIAASSAARAIRTRDAEGSILLVSVENNRPYDRSALSTDWLRKEVPTESLFTLPQDWLAGHSVELRTGRRVAHLDLTRRTATLATGEEIAFDQLLLATGASAKHLEVPGGVMPNVLHLRTLEDGDRLQHTIDKALVEGRLHPKGRGKATVVGAGVLGVEVAASLIQRGISVDLVAAKSHPLDRVAGDSIGRVVSQLLERHGVKIHANSSPIRIDGAGRAQKVVLDASRSIECDFVVATVGVVANKDLIRHTALSAEKHILVNDQCRTNFPGIYAAGDCCVVLDSRFGKHRQLDHPESSMRLGEIAGINMSGGNETWTDVGHYTVSIFDQTLHVWGEGRVVDHRIIRDESAGDAHRLIEIGVDGTGQVAQIVTLGDGIDEKLMEALVAKRLRINGNQEKIKDPAVPLSSWLDG